MNVNINIFFDLICFRQIVPKFDECMFIQMPRIIEREKYSKTIRNSIGEVNLNIKLFLLRFSSLIESYAIEL